MYIRVVYLDIHAACYTIVFRNCTWILGVIEGGERLKIESLTIPITGRSDRLRESRITRIVRR